MLSFRCARRSLVVATLTLAASAVRAEAPREFAEISLDDLLTAGLEVTTKKATSLRDSPGIVTVVIREEILRSGARDLLDVLNLVPGFQSGIDTWNEISVGVRGNWGFEGKVVDLLDGKPVLGAKIYFSDPSTGRNFSTETDYDGHYSLEVKPLEAGGYLAQIMHPEFEGRWWEGKNAKLGKKQRYQLAGRSAGDAIAYSGKSGAGTVVDFAVVPKTLTPEEKKDLCSAAPNSPACSK